ncbi:MAG TPA: 3-deoxy-D-manno-octulosonate 8-phosphate phosphatase [Bacteroidales bacterium]|nr:3-deoxy-D-manno-octulosonate 8-phosphate phosphatase [Bacteroidales bacterium]HRZ50166.1 3-deoxy-D-manno-octulosonate 8-phosphate phosphatase [Bacteroidales bacterium]
MSNYKEKLASITTFVFDYDGVFTDGVVYLSDKGDQFRGAHARDGYALQLAARNNYRIMVITGALSDGIVHRMERLGIHDVHTGAFHKADVFAGYCRKHNLAREEVLVMGDDIPDLPILREAWVSCCPSDAVWEVRSAVDYVSHYPGGRGCVRDIIEQVMRLQGKWMKDDAFIW